MGGFWKHIINNLSFMTEGKELEQISAAQQELAKVKAQIAMEKELYAKEDTDRKVEILLLERLKKETQLATEEKQKLFAKVDEDTSYRKTQTEEWQKEFAAIQVEREKIKQDQDYLNSYATFLKNSIPALRQEANRIFAIGGMRVELGNIQQEHRQLAAIALAPELFQTNSQYISRVFGVKVVETPTQEVKEEQKPTEMPQIEEIITPEVQPQVEVSENTDNTEKIDTISEEVKKDETLLEKLVDIQEEVKEVIKEEKKKVNKTNKVKKTKKKVALKKK